MVGVVSLFLLLGIATFRWDLLSGLILLLLLLVFSSHGYDLLVVGRLGSPLLLADKPIVLGFGHLEENIVGKRELPIKVIVILTSNVSLEVVAGYDLICIEEDLDGVVD
jgi:hypothetical protein